MGYEVDIAMHFFLSTLLKYFETKDLFNATLTSNDELALNELKALILLKLIVSKILSNSIACY